MHASADAIKSASYTQVPKLWWLRTEDNMFTIKLAMIVEEQSFAPQESIFKVSFFLLVEFYID
jgi:hypothetical protein